LRGKQSALMSKVKIAIVAPAARLLPENAQAVQAIADRLYGDRAELVFHAQSFLSFGHFAGEDDTRAAAFLEIANDPSFDAVWAARGGYGSGRIAEAVLAGLGPNAREKVYLGYSDFGYLLSALYNEGYPVAHGPVAYDVRRGDAPIERALKFLVDGAPETLEPTVLESQPVAAFNMIVLGNLIGTNLQPKIADHVLMLEEVSEHLYAVDRAFQHITSNSEMRKVAGIKLGRCNDIPDNDRPFGATEEEIAQHWCTASGIPYLGRADIGHDAENKIVPFGRWR
jgi:muramoyltetrapeptide carboxypeptidase